MRWTSKHGLRRAALLALGAANLVLLLAICMHSPVRAQQRPLQPSSPNYVRPQPTKSAAPPAAAVPPAPVPADAATGNAATSVATPSPIPMPPPPPRAIIVIDPAHGGSETGAKINDHLAEKDVTLALAARLRSTLQSHNFVIVSTRDGDPASGLTTNQRAEIANHTTALACLVLHATATGNGVHLYTSSLAPAEKHGVLPWATAQAAYVQQSAGLQKELSTAFTHAQIFTFNAQADVAPLDNLTCPAVTVELSPYLAADAGNTISVNDPDYLQHVAETIATALVFWRGHQSGPANGPLNGIAP